MPTTPRPLLCSSHHLLSFRISRAAFFACKSSCSIICVWHIRRIHRLGRYIISCPCVHLSIASSIGTSTPAPSRIPTKIPRGAIAGIVIGVIALLILVAAAALFWRRRKNKEGAGVGRSGSIWRKAELGTNPAARVELPGEMDIKEMPSDVPPVELPGSPPPAGASLTEPVVGSQPTTVEQDQLPMDATIRSPTESPMPHDLSER
jgi:hypothetical protein